MADPNPPPAPSPPGRDPAWIAAIASAVVAFAVRAAWLVHVQRPADTVYSDMLGYLLRARRMLDGNDAEVCFAPGTHWLYAAEMAAFGRNGLAAMGWVQVVLGALVAPAAVLLARRCLGSVGAAAIVGIAVALWYPLVTYGGFFSSEVPYTLALVASTWAWVRYLQTGRGAALAGGLVGLAYLVRPPILVAIPLLVAWAIWRRVGTVRGLAAFLAPVVCAVALGAARYHDRSGRVGLIADNGAVMSLFAFTDYAGLVATEQKGFHPPARGGLGPEFRFVGPKCDPTLLTAERNRVIAASSWSEIAVRLERNVRFLFADNTMWPERNEAKEGPRRRLFDAWPPLVTGVLLPLAAVGAVGKGIAAWRSRRGPTAGGGEVDAAVALLVHLLVLGLTALAYTGEIRYRVPYDPLLIILAAVGPVWMARRWRSG